MPASSAPKHKTQDPATRFAHFVAKKRRALQAHDLRWAAPPSRRDLAVTALVLAAATAMGSVFSALQFTEANIITVYLLGVLLTAMFVSSPVCNVISSLASVLAFNYFFTEPRLTLHAYEPGYPATFGIMLIASLMTGTLAVQNSRNAQEKERAAQLAQNEQLRANLLRAISHDLRTPLTSITGNAGYLLSDYQKLDDATRTQAFTDIYDDSLWLTSVVENLLSVTRLEEGRMNFHITGELVDEVMEEALRHVNRHSVEHTITLKPLFQLLMARMDATLITQVIINLVDNAIKYTPAGSCITLSAWRQGDMVHIAVADDGPGIADADKKRVFEMFFTGDAPVADGRRSLGLGLALCRSIVNAHGGEIHLRDNVPHGCVFTFTLPCGEVPIHE